MAVARIAVVVEVVDIERSRWCDRCSLPAGLRFTMARRVSTGHLSLFQIDRCRDCDPA